jgi:hypothetical protein
MCRKSSDEKEAHNMRMTSPSPSSSLHKPPAHLVIRAVFSACSLGFVLLALLLPSAEPNDGRGSSSGSSSGSSTTTPPSSSSLHTINTTRAGFATTTTTTTAPLSRGKHIGLTFQAKDLYQAYREIQQDYQERAFSAKTPWTILTQHDGVQVALLEHPTDPLCPYVRLSATIPVPVADCWEFLQLDNWDETMLVMDPFYEGVELFGDFAYDKVSMRLARKRTTRILAFKKRDFVFLSVSEDVPMKDGTWVSGTVSVQTPKIPRHDDYTRAYQDSIAFYKPVMVVDDGREEQQEHTQLTIVCRIDLNDNSGGNGAKGGWIPMWLYVKTIGATGARSVTSMRDVLIEQRQKQLLDKLHKDGLQKDDDTTLIKRVRIWKRKSKKSIVPHNESDRLTSSDNHHKGWKLPFFGGSKRDVSEAEREEKDKRKKESQSGTLEIQTAQEGFWKSLGKRIFKSQKSAP